MASKQNIPKRHHWVPRVYLKQFATSESMGTDRPKVWVWDKTAEQDRRGPTPVSAICSRNNLYTTKHIDGSRDWSMEVDLRKLERRAGVVWPTLVGSDSALNDPEIRTFLADFVAQMHLRNKWIYDKYHDTAKLAGKLYGSPESDPSGGTLDVTDAANFAKGLLVNSIRDSTDRIATLLSEKRWIIYRFPSRIVATNDRPVIFYESGKGTSRPSLSESKVFFPLSADRILYMDNLIDHPANESRDGPPTMPSVVNALVEHQALRFVFGASPVSELIHIDE